MNIFFRMYCVGDWEILYESDTSASAMPGVNAYAHKKE